MSQSPYHASSRKRAGSQKSARARSSRVNQKGQDVILSVLVCLSIAELGFFLRTQTKCQPLSEREALLVVWPQWITREEQETV